MRGVAGLDHNGDRVTYHRAEKWHEILYRLKIDGFSDDVPLSDLLPAIAGKAILRWRYIPRIPYVLETDFFQ